MTNTLDDLINQLCEVGNDAVDRGLVLASGGNLSARVPGGEVFAVSGKGTFLDKLTPSDFTVMSLDGTIISGAPQPSSEWKLHQRTYIARADANAIIHVHPQYAVLLDALDYEIRLITLDHAVYVKSIGHTPYHPNGSDELAEGSAAEAKSHNCVIQGYHGCSAIAEDVTMAYRRALNLEEAAAATFRALQLGDTTTTFPREHLTALQHS